MKLKWAVALLSLHVTASRGSRATLLRACSNSGQCLSSNPHTQDPSERPVLLFPRPVSVPAPFTLAEPEDLIGVSPTNLAPHTTRKAVTILCDNALSLGFRMYEFLVQFTRSQDVVINHKLALLLLPLCFWLVLAYYKREAWRVSSPKE